LASDIQTSSVPILILTVNPGKHSENFMPMHTFMNAGMRSLHDGKSLTSGEFLTANPTRKI
jgi:hypothetical protein